MTKSEFISTGESGGIVAFLGPLGTFTHAAVDRYFGLNAEKLSVSAIDDVFIEVESGRARYGVVPVENSTEGAVNNTQDCLIDTSLNIIAEVIIPIEHNFLMRQDAETGKISRIVSHRQSLAQCRRWLKTNWPQIPTQEVSSNAEAARLASEDGSVAAIAGERAAALYGLKIHARRIQDQHNNSTRFLVLANELTHPTGRDKTSILVYTENKPGALFRVLEPFEKQQVSLTRIEARPARDSIWDYVFFIDFEGHRDDPAVQSVFNRLQGRAVKIKTLGSYPAALNSEGGDAA
ncbi:MAG: prephenate dehydratase [Gammaproteobacteria bacterium]|nr:prephenate dehydratase [Gammaproteobacteria bacterium]